MRLRNITGARDIICDSDYVIHEPEQYKGRMKELFKNQNPVHIEIGMGKGRFIYELAGLHPEINYIGIEKYSSVLLRAIEKMKEEPLPNLLFIRMDAEAITDVFDKEEISRIYLNFSDPWPKDRHAKRRLPSKEFLARYHQILQSSGRIEFKTDNLDLFNFAVEQIEEADWKADQITYDLHHNREMMQDNIMTEYEEKFSSIGNHIYKYCISR